MFRVSSPRLLDVLILASSLIGSLLLVTVSDWEGRWFIENGPWEMLQIGALLAACIIASRASGRLDGWAGRLALALALFSLLFLVRELPRCASPYYIAGPCMPGDTKTMGYFLPLPLWVWLVVRNPAIGPRALRWAEFRHLPRFVWRALPLLVVITLLGVGQFADGRNLPVVEELAEFLAYLFLAVAALSAAEEGDRRTEGETRPYPLHVWSRP